MTAFTVQPFSRGHIHITGPKLDEPVGFTSGFFAGDHGRFDLQAHVWLYKKQREAIRRMLAYRGEMVSGFQYSPHFIYECHPGSLPRRKSRFWRYGINAKCRQARFHPPFAAGSDAALVELGDSPLPADALEIRGNVGTTWHLLGTCKMQPREKMGVVDPTLSVYGVQGLKIADMSIAPRNVPANTCDTAITIGEKAADIFI